MTRCATSLLVLLAEVDAVNPNRDRTSDGGLGDAAHAARPSSHNPDSHGVYRARDFDCDGIDADRLAEHIRRRGQAGDPRLRNGGYVIWNRRIAGPDARGWQWRPYDGENDHTHHVHVSCTDDPAHYDDPRPWGWLAAPKPPAPTIVEDDMAKLITVDGTKMYAVTAGTGARALRGAEMRVLQRLKLLPTTPEKVSETELGTLLAAADGR